MLKQKLQFHLWKTMRFIMALIDRHYYFTDFSRLLLFLNLFLETEFVPVKFFWDERIIGQISRPFAWIIYFPNNCYNSLIAVLTKNF